MLPLIAVAPEPCVGFRMLDTARSAALRSATFVPDRIRGRAGRLKQAQMQGGA